MAWNSDGDLLMRFVRLSLVVALIGVLLGGGSVVGAAFAEDSAGTTLQD
jgi:hypothetical protein